MKQNVQVLMFTAILGGSALGSTGAPQEALSVMPLTANRIEPELVKVLDEILLNVIQTTGRYRVLGASDIVALLGHERLKDSVGCDDVACFAGIGGALGVRYLVAGSVGKIGDQVTIALKLIDLQLPQVVGRVQRLVDNDENVFVEALTDVAQELLGALTPEPPAELEAVPPPDPTPTLVLSPEQQALLDQTTSTRRWTWVFFSGALGASGGGAYLLTTHAARRRDQEKLYSKYQQGEIPYEKFSRQLKKNNQRVYLGWGLAAGGGLLGAVSWYWFSSIPDIPEVSVASSGAETSISFLRRF